MQEKPQENVQTITQYYSQAAQHNIQEPYIPLCLWNAYPWQLPQLNANQNRANALKILPGYLDRV